MAGKSLKARALLRAAEVLGGVPELARRLGITKTKLELYLEDLQRMPDFVFFKVVDILTDDQLQKLLGETTFLREGSRGDYE